MVTRSYVAFGLGFLALAFASISHGLVINNDLVGHDYSSWSGPTGTATNGTSTTVNGANFQVAPDNSGTGSGAFDPFVRTDGNPKDYEVGFNTGGRPFDTSLYDMKTDSNFTHSILLGDLSTITVGGVSYVELILDLGEPSAKEKPLISLKTLELWVNTTTGGDVDYSDGLGTKIWSLDGDPQQGDTTLNLDYDILGGGNGKYDIIAKFPVALFAGYAATDYLYLYNEFGLFLGDTSPPTYSSEGTYEEWARKTGGGFVPPPGPGPAPAPEPATLALLGLGAVGLGLTRRKRGA